MPVRPTTEGLVNQAAIHPGSIPAAQVNAAAASPAAGAAKRSVAPTMSSASQLIGGAPSPAALVSQGRPYGGVNASYMIGDYMTPPGPFPPAAASQPYKP